MDIATYIIADVNKIPENNIVEILYDSVLEAQLVPSNVRTALSKTPIDKKWATIVAYKTMVESEKGGDRSSYGNKDKQLLKSLRNVRKRPDITALLGIKSRLTTGNKSWMEGFIADKGISVLLSAMESRLSQVPMGELDGAVLYELISCLNPIMNNGLTMKIFLSTKRALRIITQCLIFQWKTLAIAVLEILSVICDYSNDAAFYVVKYFRNISKSRREPPFKYLVDALLTEDVEIKTGILLLINQILASIEDLDKRMILRSELKVVQFGHICDQTYNELLQELQVMKSPDYQPKQRSQSSFLMTNGRNTVNGSKKKRSTLTNEQIDDNNVAKTYATALGIEILDDDDEEEYSQEFADDGKTPICPLEGIMAGVCISGKNRGKMSKSILKEFGNKSTKDRWYILSGDRLTWWGTDCRDISSEKAHLDVSEILHIRSYSTNPELISPEIYPFEVETKERVYSFGCLNEVDKENWVTALYIARDKSVLKKYSYNFNLDSSLDPAQFENLINVYKKQIVVYDVLTTEDYEQCITAGNINLTDPVDIVKYLQYETSVAGLNDKFLKVLQEFIIVPSDTKFGDLFWEKVLDVCRDLRSLLAKQDYGITSNIIKDYSMTSYELDLESCVRILKKKDNSQTGHKINEINKLTMELFTKKEEIERLQQEIKTIRSNGLFSPANNNNGDEFFVRSSSFIDYGENPMTMKSTQQPVNENIATEIPENSSTANRAKALSAMFSHKPIHLPQQEKEKKVALPHVDHSQGIIIPQNLPKAVRGSHREIPEPPLLPGMRASIRKKARVPSNAVKRLPLSVGPTPSKKMKMIFWNKINEERGIWEEVNKIQVDQLHINFQKLEEKFAVPEESSHTLPGITRSTVALQEKKNKKVSILDSKRSHLIEISLNRIRKQPEEIAVMITQLNPDVLTLDLTEILSSIIPTSKEIELVKSYQGDITQLGLVEQVVLAVSPIPRLEKRLWCHRTIFTWPHAMDKLIGRLNIIESGCNELMQETSKSQFIQLFSYILSIGNYLNYGTHRITCAIQLESLLKLSSIKSNNNPNNPIRNHKETLLHYILQEMNETHQNNLTCQQQQQQQPFHQYIKQSYKYIFLLSDMNYKQIQQEYKQCLDDYNRINTEYELLARGNNMNNLLNSGGDTIIFLHQRLETFLILSKERILYLEKYLQNLNNLLEKTFEFFGEKFIPPNMNEQESHTTTDSCQKFFHTFLEFLQLIQKCSDDLEKWIEEENKLSMKQQSKQTIIDNEPEKEEEEEEQDRDIFDTEAEENLTTKENLFSRFRNQQTGTADDLISQLKRKMYRRQSTRGLKSLNSMSLDEREQLLSTTTAVATNEPSSSTSSFVFPGLRKVPQGERKMI